MNRLFTDSIDYLESQIDFYKKRIIFFKVINVALNILTILAAFASATITSLLLSKLIYSTFPDWFFYATAGITAFTGLSSSLLNFFIIKDNIKLYQSNLYRLETEFISFTNKTKKIYQNRSESKNKYFLYLSVASINRSMEAKKEMKNVG